MDLLGSPVEIHLAGGEQQSMRLGRGGQSGGMLTVLRQGSGLLLWAQAAIAAVDWGSSFLGWTAQATL